MSFLYMPMEIAARELDSRLLISLFATRSGLEVVIGQKWLLQKNARWMPKGFWIFKTLTPGDAKHMQRIKNLGHRIGAIDEEMPGIGDSSQPLRWVDKRSVEASEAIFCLGEKHVESMTRAYPEHKEKLIITGNPRWDFLRPDLRQLYEKDAQKIKQDFGPIILINTNIGRLNSSKASPEAIIRAQIKDGRIDLKREVDREFTDAGEAWERANFAAIAPLARRLSKEFPDHLIVLRPHPTEKLETYEQALAGEKRVKIIREGPAASWIAASDLLVHTSCTTATEAYALGQPSVCFQPAPSLMHNYFLSGALSVIAKSEDGVIDAARSILAGKKDALMEEEWKTIFNSFFAAQTGQFASERIANHVAQALSVNKNGGPLLWKPGLLFRKKWFPTKFQRRIFPLQTANEITARLEALATIFGGMSVPKVQQIGDGQYHIHQ